MPTIAHDGHSVHYGDAGAGAAVVLLHAGGSSGAQWRTTSAILEQDWRVISPDFFGFGKTDDWGGAEQLSHDHQARLIGGVIRAAKAAPAHVVGHSYGGAGAVRLALAAPELFRSLVLIEPMLAPLLNQADAGDIFDEYMEMADVFLDHADAGRDEDAWRLFIDYRNGAGAWAGLSEKARTRFLGQTRQTAAAFRSNLANPTTLEDCRSIAIPTLVVCGERTAEPDRRVTEILRDTVPDCDYRVLEGAEHMSPLTHGEDVAEAILGHIEGSGA